MTPSFILLLGLAIAVSLILKMCFYLRALLIVEDIRHASAIFVKTTYFVLRKAPEVNAKDFGMLFCPFDSRF